jgi:ABC-type histidine transport system ATPase subunit
VKIIRFFSGKEYKGLGQPELAKKFLPQWYKDSETVTIDEKGEEHSGLKRCIPFLDSMISGYMLVTPVDIFISKNKDGSLNIKWKSIERLEDFISERGKD